MPFKSFFKLGVFLLSVVSSFAFAADQAPFPAQILMNVYQMPAPMKADDQFYLVYEIYLSNLMKSPATITAFSIDGDNKTDLFTLKDLDTAIKSQDEKNETNKLSFQPGETKKIFVWIPFTNQSEIPMFLAHHLTIDSSFKNKRSLFQLGSFNLAVENSAPVIISPPLRGKNWLAGNAPSNTSDHRRTGLILNGRPYYAQRYAIDFVQMGEDGASYTGDVHKNASYHCYNQDVLSVGDGIVVQTQDGIPENVPNSDKFAVDLNQKTLPGNYIIIDLGSGKYAGYAHLIPGSLKVKIGDRVARNQVIAKLGNSGNSSEPHLHFQVTNTSSFLESDGVPYGFDHFTAHPSQLITDANGSMKITVNNEPFKEYTNQLVLENTLMNFE